MPTAPTYPGVYIEEVPSGVRTITGVATSVTAFLGRATRGPVDQATPLFSFADYERMFGGLHEARPMSYAVRDFFRNGGSQALVVRAFKRGTGAAARGVAAGEVGTGAVQLKLEAANPGAWGNKLKAVVDFDGLGKIVAENLGLAEGDLFNLKLTDEGTGREEYFRNLTYRDHRRRVDRVLVQESSLARVALKDDGQPDVPGTGLPPKGSADFSDGNDGVVLKDAADWEGSAQARTGMHALDKADLFNLLCIPPDTRDGNVPVGVWRAAAAYCRDRRAFLIVDADAEWALASGSVAEAAKTGVAELALTGLEARNAALFFPRLLQPDPLRQDQMDTFVPCGTVAGVMARTDAQRGVWKAPAGTDATLTGVSGLQTVLGDGECGALNPKGINCLRSLPVYGKVIWGTRTLRGDDQMADEYKYIPVRRLALFLEESLYRGTQWVVFEPNDEPLWAQIRLNIGAFMHSLFRQGAFQGTSPREAYFVKCDKETTTQDDINRGIVNILVGFAPLKPAEFVFIRIQQIAGQLAA